MLAFGIGRIEVVCAVRQGSRIPGSDLDLAMRPGWTHPVEALSRAWSRGGVSLTRTSLQNAQKPRLSGRKLAPLGQSSRAALLENVAAVEVTVRVEVIEQGGVNRGKLLQGLNVPEPRYRS
jgi:hypothetical protein